MKTQSYVEGDIRVPNTTTRQEKLANTEKLYRKFRKY